MLRAMEETIVLANDKVTAVTGDGDGDGGGALWIRSDQLAEATGFELKPHGACLGGILQPLPSSLSP